MIIGLYKYLTREELDRKHIITNILVLVSLLVQFPFIIVNTFIGVSVSASLMDVVAALVCAAYLYIANRIPNSNIPINILIFVVNVVVFPALFFTGGGRKTGTIIWMLFGVLCSWILIDGKARYIQFMIGVVVDGLCMYVEGRYPRFISFLENPHDEAVDTLTSLVIVVVIIGALVDYEVHLYKRKETELEEKERELREVNKNLEKLNEELANASTAKSNFLANMSHEIRTPINAVLGMNEMILRESTDSDITAYANDIDSASHQLLSLVNDILDFSKIESGKLELHPVEYELFSVMNDCYNIILIRAKKKQLQVLVENDPEMPAYLFGDEVRIRQIITNLLTNAVKYTREGYVKLSMHCERIAQDNVNLIIEVKDTGIGIPDAAKKDLFIEFTRVEEQKNRNIEGTGLGLTIVKRFVEMMNGTIAVDSIVDRGSTFTITIPQKIANDVAMGEFAQRYRHKEFLSDDPYKVKKEAAENDIHAKLQASVGEQEITGASKLKAPKTDKGKASFTAENARILIVDDVKMNLNVVRLLLKNTKMEMDMAGSGEEALKYTLMKRYDLILMDHMMPNMDGIETFHNIQSQNMGLNNDTKVIILTANAIQDAQDMYMKEGFSSYLTKPVKAEKLEEELLRFLPKEKVTLSE